MWRCGFIDERNEFYFEICFSSLDSLKEFICILSKPYISLVDCEWIGSELDRFNLSEQSAWRSL